jgi:hypothetical protein
VFVGLYHSPYCDGRFAFVGGLENGILTAGILPPTRSSLGIVLCLTGRMFDDGHELSVASQDVDCLPGHGRVNFGGIGQFCFFFFSSSPSSSTTTFRVSVSVMDWLCLTCNSAWWIMASGSQYQWLCPFAWVELPFATAGMCPS